MEEPREDRSRAPLSAGLDEAGLGPLLGPLVLGWAVLELPPERGHAAPDAWQRLDSAVARARGGAGQRLVVADSKQVFDRTPEGARQLESTALAFLAAARGGGAARAPSWMWDGCARPELRWLEQAPGFAELPRELPLWTPVDELEARLAALRAALAAADMRVLDCGVRVVPAGELNESLARTNNKARSLWAFSSEILRALWRAHGERGLAVEIDKHGGRARYRELIAASFPDCALELHAEGALRSSYTLREDAPALFAAAGARRMQLAFAPRADQGSFATALASCLAKYARELAMHAFNRHFAGFDPELRPTAGYVTDARRWLREGQRAIAASGHARERLVRAR